MDLSEKSSYTFKSKMYRITLRYAKDTLSVKFLHNNVVCKTWYYKNITKLDIPWGNAITQCIIRTGRMLIRASYEALPLLINNPCFMHQETFSDLFIFIFEYRLAASFKP